MVGRGKERRRREGLGSSSTAQNRKETVSARKGAQRKHNEDHVKSKCRVRLSRKCLPKRHTSTRDAYRICEVTRSCTPVVVSNTGAQKYAVQYTRTAVAFPVLQKPSRAGKVTSISWPVIFLLLFSVFLMTAGSNFGGANTGAIGSIRYGQLCFLT